MLKQGRTIAIGGIVCAMLGVVVAVAQSGDTERRVKENEVPAAAMAALKKLAGSATIHEFEEETINGKKFYEGEWKGPDSHMEAKVTENGDVLEIEESISADEVPAAVRTEAEKMSDKGGKIKYEKITLFVYEAEFRKDGKGHEIILTPDGRRFQQIEDEDGQGDDDSDDVGDDDDDNDD